jgi:hypothetical protein
VHARRFDEEIVIVDLKAGVYFGLDEVGAAIWEELLRGRTLPEVAAALEASYDVPLAKLAEDVRALVDALLTRGLLEEAT